MISRVPQSHPAIDYTGKCKKHKLMHSNQSFVLYYFKIIIIKFVIAVKQIEKFLKDLPILESAKFLII